MEGMSPEEENLLRRYYKDTDLGVLQDVPHHFIFNKDLYDII